ncbi:hypothetical protein J7E73_28425 [Paenibacillus albidus]|uniref:M1 family aminopeptidase n=1 Tax=Paenibacillus albidus TaxID=2041023 RepID=UPI001BEBBC84|nr:M1 family aminopeptidase [Paenibacillus albidus]MBT2292972.1 hypothetical protein [Paenibacillus albidus]
MLRSKDLLLYQKRSDRIRCGELKAEQVKEFMLSFTRDLTPIRQSVDDIEIKLWAGEQNPQKEKALEIAAEALHYFNQNLGPYPHKQLDVILGDRLSMEYPGIVTAYTSEDVKHVLVHEIAHQWFYGMVNNDAFHEGWLDEGMAELAVSLFLQDYQFSENLYKPNGVYSNLPLTEFQEGEIPSVLYAQPVLKFKELLESHGYNGMEFLRAYFSTYKYKQVDTKEFVSL